MSENQNDSSSNSSLETSGSASPSFPAWLKIAILAGVVGLASVGYLKQNSVSGPNFAAVEGEPEESRELLQDFIVTDAGGAQKKLSEFRGSVVILSFWASWCTPCLVELPTFAELQKKFSGRGLTILPVNVDEGDDGTNFAKDLWSKKGFPFVNYFDRSKEVAQSFDVDMLPSNFVIDREGRLVFSSFGANDWSSAETVEFLEQLLSEKQPES